MSIEQQFDREQNAHAATAFDELNAEERAAVIESVRLLLDNSGSKVVAAAARLLGLLHKTYAEELFEPLELPADRAHAIDESRRARCAAIRDAIELVTTSAGLETVLNNLYKE